MDLAKIRKKLKKKPARKQKAETPDVPKKTEEPERREVTPVETVELLCFRVSSEYYALKMEDVQEIINLRPITPVPRTADFIEGIISLRGKVLPVFDLKQRLNIKTTDGVKDSDRPRIIIVRGPKGPAGLKADTVLEIAVFNVSELKPPPGSMSEQEAQFIDAVFVFKEHLFSVLDINEVLSF